MIILFDIGNTNIVLGICKNEKIIKTYRFVTNPKLTEDDYYQKINSSLKEHLLNEMIEGSIISSVVPQLDFIFLNLMEKYYNIKPLIVKPGLKSGLKIMLENPKQLGADLLCDVVGTYYKYGGPAIVVDMGTATKLMVLSSNKEFLGGAICAGLKGSLDSLIDTTSKLSRTTIEIPQNAIGTETSSCIQSGIVYGHIAMIDGMIDRFKQELKEENAKMILTGGYSKIIKDHLKNDFIYDENILLEGLYQIYLKNK